MKDKKIYVYIILHILMGFIIGILYNKTNNILFFLLYEIWRNIIIIGLIFLIISIPLGLLLNNIKKIKLTEKQQIIIVIIISFVLGLIPINYNLYNTRYKVEGEKLYGIDMNIRVVKDIIIGETVEIKSDDVKIEEYYSEHYAGSKYGSKLQNVYYLKINDGEYEIPITNKDKVESLLYKNSYEEKRMNTIVVYKNSKLIKEINGIKLSDSNGNK